MARGRFFQKMDAKGRVAIPAGLRVELQSRGQEELPPILTSLVDCRAVGVFAHEQWTVFEQRLEEKSQSQPELMRFRRLIISSAEECKLDGQGRVLVPTHLREYAGLERDVVIAGVGRRIEIWDRSRFDEELASIQADGPNISRAAADLGL
jgi:MraZ protein